MHYSKTRLSTCNQKMDCALAMIRRNHSVSRTCRLLRVARSRVNVLLKRADDWKDRRLACNRSIHFKQGNLLLVSKPSLPGYSKEHNGQVSIDTSDKRWCSDGLEFKCFNGEHISMTFVLECCDREVISFVARNGRGLPAWMAQEQVLLAVNKRFGSVNQVPMLTDNGSAYTSQKTRHLLKALGMEDCKTAVGSPQSNGMAESFVKTLKRDYLP